MSATLTILDPPGEQIGLVFGGAAELRVRYVSPAGAPVAGGAIDFAIVADPARSEDAGGASLEATSARADEEGVARVNIVAGSVRTNFRVEVNAAGAAPATFYVTVANEGFSALVVNPIHAGDRPEEEIDVVEVRLYGSAMSCAALSADAPAPSPYPPRAAATFGQPVSFTALGSTEAYSVLAWGRDAGGHVLGEGCVDLAPSQIRPGATLRLDVVVADRLPKLAAGYDLASSLDLSPVVAEALGTTGAWHVAACPDGAAQLVLDCAIDALDVSDPLDCVVEGAGADALSLEAARGVAGPDGCRGPVTATGATSAELLVNAVLAPGMTTPGDILPEAAAELPLILARLDFASRLDVQGGAGWHHLGDATLGMGYTIDLAASSRPIVDAALAVWLAGATVTLGEHGFTLRLGAFLRDAFVAELSALHGITVDPEWLGTELVAAAASPVGAVGCDAVSEVACAAAALPVDCLAAACAQMIPVLDGQLAQPFLRLDGSNLDFTLAGSAEGLDPDGDLTLDGLIGSWSATIYLADGTGVPVDGTFTTP